MAAPAKPSLVGLAELGGGISGVPGPDNIGPAPLIHWLALDVLVVDSTYQRPIGLRSHRIIRRIAAAFDWTMFSPVVCAAVEGGRFAIIDGQHRCLAARMIGIREVPVQIVVADRRRQAAAFAAINGTVTQVTALQRHRAAMAADDPEALALSEALGVAGVTIAPYPKNRYDLKPGETFSAAMLARAYRVFGRETLITALQCITETENNQPGAISPGFVLGICDALHEAPAWREAGSRLLEAFDAIDLQEIADRARIGAGLRGEVAACVRAKLQAALGSATRVVKLHKATAA